MNKKISPKSLVLPLVLLITLGGVGCKRGHNDNIQENGPDQLPMRLQLPKDGAAEGFRILQYQQDNVTRKLQQSAMKQGPYAGGRQVRIFDNDNNLSQILTYYPSNQGAPEQIGYRAIFAGGRYQYEESFTPEGARQTDGKRLVDGTFEQSTYATGGLSIAKHAIFGRLMSDQEKLEWKLFSSEQYRDDRTLSVSTQRMDDNHTETKYFDVHNLLTESVSSDKSGTATSETDYRADGKTPLVRYDFSGKVIWSFDEKGVILTKRKWYDDQSQQLTVYKAGIPIYIQDWEVDTAKSDKNVTPAKIVLYLSWVKELHPDGTDGREINILVTTRKISSITVNEVPPPDAKFKPADGPVLGSTAPAKNWVPLPPVSKVNPATSVSGAALPKAATQPGTPAPGTSPSVGNTVPSSPSTPPVSPYWKSTGAHEVFTYSPAGYLIKVDSFKPGQSTATTVIHKESEHERVRVNPILLNPLPAGNTPPDKPKDPTAPAAATPFDLDDYN